MNNIEFEKIKEDFTKGDTDKKINIYVSTQDLDQSQYKELLRLFPLNEIQKLEEAMG